MLIFNVNNTTVNIYFPPPKNNNSNSLINILVNAKDKKIIHKKIKKQNDNIETINEETNYEKYFHSKRRLYFMDKDKDLENILNNKNNNALKLKPTFSQDHKNIFNNNINSQNGNGKYIFGKLQFSPTIQIQTPILNINNKKAISNIKKLKKKNAKNIKLETTNINNDKSCKIKSKGKKPLGKDKFQNKKINTNFSNKKENTVEKRNRKKDIIYFNKDAINLSQSDEDLQDMDYEKAIIYDKRTYLRMYWAFLVDSQIILGTFCTSNYLHLLVIKLSFFIYTFQISFFLNAFFYTDEYISNAYHNNGVLDFFSGLPKSIYSFIATSITTNLLKMLSNSKSELMKIIKQKRKEDNYISLVNMKLTKLRNKLIIYFFFVFSLGLLFLYYVSAFCAVYIYSQKYWFIGCLTSFGIDSLVSVILCVILALFRYIAIQNHLKCFYILGNIISIFA